MYLNRVFRCPYYACVGLRRPEGSMWLRGGGNRIDDKTNKRKKTNKMISSIPPSNDSFVYDDMNTSSTTSHPFFWFFSPPFSSYHSPSRDLLLSTTLRDQITISSSVLPPHSIHLPFLHPLSIFPVPDSPPLGGSNASTDLASFSLFSTPHFETFPQALQCISTKKRHYFKLRKWHRKKRMKYINKRQLQRFWQYLPSRKRPFQFQCQWRIRKRRQR